MIFFSTKKDEVTTKYFAVNSEGKYIVLALDDDLDRIVAHTTQFIGDASFFTDIKELDNIIYHATQLPVDINTLAIYELKTQIVVTEQVLSAVKVK